MTFKMAYHIPFFARSAPPGELFGTVVAQAKQAELSGFDLVTVMDHFEQPHFIEQQGEPGRQAYTTLEPYMTLAALAACTDRIGLATMVTSNTFRNPALLAKMVTSLDVISGGRATLGLGAGWYEPEHTSYGIEFGTLASRFGRLSEALQIIVPMLRGHRPSVNGQWYRAEGVPNEPRIRDDLPLLLGGAGEKKMFGLAAKYADHINIICAPSELPRKIQALRDRCSEVDRDFDSLHKSFAVPMIMDEDGECARRTQREFFALRGVDIDGVGADRRRELTERQFVGSPDEIVARLRDEVVSVGISGFAVNMITNGETPSAGMIQLAGSSLRRLVGDVATAGSGAGEPYS